MRLRRSATRCPKYLGPVTLTVSTTDGSAPAVASSVQINISGNVQQNLAGNFTGAALGDYLTGAMA